MHFVQQGAHYNIITLEFKLDMNGEILHAALIVTACNLTTLMRFEIQLGRMLLEQRINGRLNNYYCSTVFKAACRSVYIA